MLGDKDERDDYSSQRCQLCFHGLVIHRRNGGCGAYDCMCGWERRENGELFEKSTGLSAADIRGVFKTKKLAPKGVRPGLMRIPCYFCGAPPESIDHMLPRCRGGTNHISNLVSACKVCNNLKGERTYDEFIVYCQQTVESCNPVVLGNKTKHQIRAESCRKVLVWHAARIKSKSPLPVV